MEGRETDLEYNLLMGLTGASVSKHLLDEHFTLLWANDFYYDMIGYPKEEYEALFHNKPDLYFKGYDEAWNILSKNVYETIFIRVRGISCLWRPHSCCTPCSAGGISRGIPSLSVLWQPA